MKATDREKRILSDSIINDRLQIVELKAQLEEAQARAFQVKEEMLKCGTGASFVPPTVRRLRAWARDLWESEKRS